MKKLSITVICVALSLMLCFTAVGYAGITSSVTVNAKATAKAQTGVYIYSVTVADGTPIKVNAYTAAVLNSTTTLTAQASSSATMTIKLYNNSASAYAFQKVAYTMGEGTYDNDNIKLTLNGLTEGQQIAAQAYLTFTLTFSYKNTAAISNRVLNSVLNFLFVPPAGYTAVNQSLDKFEQILNDTTDFSSLTAQMDDYSGNRWDDSYIGNVVGASTEDTTFLNALFTEDGINYLSLEIEGKKIPVTVMIKRENLDGNTATGDADGNEMTIYMTPDTIGRNTQTVTVYAAVYTLANKNDPNARWEQIGSLYAGKADANNYRYGGFGTSNSFDTETWRSSLTYYGLSTGKTIAQLVAAIPKD